MDTSKVPQWTADEVESLKAMWPYRSAGVIALALGKSRSAAIGKAHRLFLMKKDQSEKTRLRHPNRETLVKPPKPKVPKAPRPKKLKTHPGVIDPIVPAPKEAMVTYAEISLSKQCAYIFGHDYLAAIRRDEPVFCGAPVARIATENGEIRKSAFCAEHHRLCYTPIDARRRGTGPKHWNMKR